VENNAGLETHLSLAIIIPILNEIEQLPTLAAQLNLLKADS